MRIIRPFTTSHDPLNYYTSKLHFRNGVVKDFYMRGSIAWPEGRKEGFAIMAGLDLETGHVIIFEQFRFWTVPHWFNDDGSIHERDDRTGWHVGLVQFIAGNIGLYLCASYFYGGQHVDVNMRYAREVYGNPQVPAKLELIEVPYVAEIGPDLLHEKIKTHKFKGDTDSILNQSVVQFVNMRAAQVDYDNATLALMTLLAGFDFQPWVDLR